MYDPGTLSSISICPSKITSWHQIWPRKVMEIFADSTLKKQYQKSTTKQTHSEFEHITICWMTHPETNSSYLKICLPGPKRKFRLPSINFQWFPLAVSFRKVRQVSSNILKKRFKWCQLKSLLHNSPQVGTSSSFRLLFPSFNDSFEMSWWSSPSCWWSPPFFLRQQKMA